MKKSVILLRTVHGIFALYFISCLFYIYYAAVTKTFTVILAIALISLAIEGLLVFILNKGDCPLIHIQKKIGDPIPFFDLFLPAPIAKKAIPFFAILTLVGLVFLAVRFLQ